MYERPPGGGLTLRRIAHSVRSLGHHAAPLRADLEALASAERRFARPRDDEEIQATAIAALGAIGNEAT
jgi:hypothetical protein